MGIIGGILMFVLLMILLIVVAAWMFVRNLLGGFRNGRRNAGRPHNDSGDRVVVEEEEDALEKGAGRRYYFNRTGKVDKERAEEVDFEEV